LKVGSKLPSCLIKENIKTDSKLAYINYQIGNLTSAYTLYREIETEAYTSKQYITYFIARYNLKQLGIFLQNPFHKTTVSPEEIENLKTIDPIEDAVKLKPHTDYSLVSLIAQEDYFTDAFQNISKEAKEIVEHYNSQLQGGWSSNQHVWNLVTEFAKLETFINANYIIYDRFSNFTELFDLVIEGIFASHAMANNQPNKFTHFDDYWVNKFILYGRRKTILKCRNAFKLKVLEYKSSSSEKDSFMELAEHFFQNAKDTKDAHLEYGDTDNTYFNSKYNTIFDNLVTMASLLNLGKETIDKFANLLLDFLKSENSISRYDNDSINFFIKRREASFKKKTTVEFIKFMMRSPKFHGSSLLETLIDHFPDKQLKIKPKDFAGIIESTKVVCPTCKVVHSSEILFSLYDKVDTSQKKQITHLIQEKLP